MDIGTLLMRAQADGLYRTVEFLSGETPSTRQSAEAGMAESGWPLAADALYNRVIIDVSPGGFVAKRETWDGWGEVRPTASEAVCALKQEGA